MRNKRPGFTLIELLVVIAIIALLLSIVMPGLSMAKKKAASAACLSNARQLSMAWYMYADENDGKLASAYFASENGWIREPQTAPPAPSLPGPFDPVVTDEDEIRGIEKGVLFPYLETPDVFRCPGDKLRKRINGSRLFNSYSIATCLNGHQSNRITKINEITSPGDRYVFVENGERNRNYNWGGYWLMENPENGSDYGMWEPLAITHGNSAIFGFADAHAEVIKWHDTVVLDHYNRTEKEKYYGKVLVAPGESQDFDWLVKGWAYRHKK